MLLDNTDFIDLPKFTKGKVRDMYDMGDSLLLVATDRISAFDVVFPNLIPNKGAVLTGISEFWFDYTKDIIDNHVITADVEEYPDELKNFKKELSGRSMMVKKVEMLSVECIVRGYLEGSGLSEYQKTGKISGVNLPEGLRQADKLSEPIFTPSSKAAEGHDELITFRELKNRIGSDLAEQLKEKSLSLFAKAGEYAETKGLLLADTKFEFGLSDGNLIVADELFTPDSSRFWEKNKYSAGKAQKSFDKQYLREWLEAGDWDKTPPAPELPKEVIRQTEDKYIEAYERITGKKFLRSE